MKNIFTLFCLIVLLFLFACSGQPVKEADAALPELPVKNMVTLIDLGAKTCKPCIMMAPILEELKEEYKGRAEVVFVDVWKNPAVAKKFKVMTIPTQIFFDRKGQEIQRHVGFLDKKSIIGILETILYPRKN